MYEDIQTKLAYNLLLSSGKLREEYPELMGE
jgi:hypothetical protein